ncbi:23S rRNA (guanosine(2251)-2'-O)-methyltransferase RlmB [Fusibacter sp. JL216-2]|uniref:23S rRNA (guanosine(2251)-2'-O)-methyltransferase RlmB n=1 Tax=Fusibacter sp. JL216-2 TaxID=3071453 RepID=UPI003D334CB8
MKGIIEGRNPVIEILKSGRDVDKILVAKGNKEGSIHKIIAMAKDKKIPVQEVDRRKLDQMAESDNHQGVMAYVAAYEYADLNQILDGLEAKGENPFLIICDEINDPHNLGSILRTANATGAHAVIIPKRRSVGLTAVVAKTSAGALEYTPVCKVTNLSKTMKDLKERGIWIVGADMAGENYHFEQDMLGKLAIVVGSEGKGISRLVKENCDFLVRIPMLGQVTSLNASVAASVLMYEAVRQNHIKK